MVVVVMMMMMMMMIKAPWSRRYFFLNLELKQECPIFARYQIGHSFYERQKKMLFFLRVPVSVNKRIQAQSEDRTEADC